ncbi:MAG: hypothetical protein KZQ83_14985 [gamma proteobacterium symbiont of Taylorina sp.]|nr:hypothetical protein [gamma proteobacterium symbiont of Taylorina sp.]
MGRAKINSNKGEGLYEITYYRDTDKVVELIANLDAQITSIDERITILEPEIALWESHIAILADELNTAIDAYQACIDSTGNQESCKTELEEVTSRTTHKIEQEGLANLLVDELVRLNITKDRFNQEEIALNNAPSNEEIMDVWCLDLCARPSAEPETGIYENIGEEIAVDTEVGIVEIFNWETKSYERWIQPASYSHDPSYIPALHGVSKPSLSSDPEGFVYNFELRSPTQNWKAKYKIAIVDSIDNTNGKMYVSYPKLKDELGVLISNGTDKNKTSSIEVDIDYMNCSSLLMSASAFDIGDEVIIRFDDPNMLSPVCIGFRYHPKPCTTSGGFLLFDRNTEVMIQAYYDEINLEWAASDIAMTHGLRYWNRRSDGAYVSFGSRLGLGSSFTYNNWFSSQRNFIYINGVKYTIPTTYTSDDEENLLACLDSNDDLYVLQGLGTEDIPHAGLRLIKYDYTDWTLVVEFTDIVVDGKKGFVSTTWSSGYDGFANESGTMFYLTGFSGYATLSASGEFTAIGYYNYFKRNMCTIDGGGVQGSSYKLYYSAGWYIKNDGEIGFLGDYEENGSQERQSIRPDNQQNVKQNGNYIAPTFDGYSLNWTFTWSIDQDADIYEASDDAQCAIDNWRNNFSNLTYREVISNSRYVKIDGATYSRIEREDYSFQYTLGSVILDSITNNYPAYSDYNSFSKSELAPNPIDENSLPPCGEHITVSTAPRPTYLNNRSVGVRYNHKNCNWFPNGVFIRTEGTDTYEKASFQTAINGTSANGNILYLDIIGFTGGVKVWGVK